MAIKNIDVLVLCGGKGTRLASVVNDRPKPMAEVGKRPFLDVIIQLLIKNGFKSIKLCAGYKADYIKSYYKKNNNIKVISEKKPLGTAGAIKNAEEYIRSDDFIVLNGDSVCKVDFEELLKFHREKKADITIAVTKVNNNKDFGSVEYNRNKRITNFIEKGSTFKTDNINAGIYVLNRCVLKKIRKDEFVSLEYNIFNKIKRVFAYQIDSPMLDIGTPACYFDADNFIRKEINR